MAHATADPTKMSRDEVMRVHIEAISRSLRKIITSLSLLYPRDAVISRLKKRTVLLVDTWPVWVVEEVGAFMYKHRESIYAEDDSFFLGRSYDSEISGARSNYGEESAESFLYIIPKIKEAWKTIKPAEQQAYRTLIVSLLDDYIEYLSARLEGA